MVEKRAHLTHLGHGLAISATVVQTQLGDVARWKMSKLEIGLLGPFVARIDGAALDIARNKERMLLAALALAGSHTASSEGLIDIIWDGCPPRSGLDTLQSMVSRVRSHLGSKVIESVDHGYRLDIDFEQIDGNKFQRLASLASTMLNHDAVGAAEAADHAISLWRGSPFEDLGAATAFEAHRRRLEALYRNVVEVRLEVHVLQTEFGLAIAGLKAALVDNPYRERLWYLLVLALARDGCRVEALRTCQQLRADLAGIGLEPSRDLRELEEMVLNEAPFVRSMLKR